VKTRKFNTAKIHQLKLIYFKSGIPSCTFSNCRFT